MKSPLSFLGSWRDTVVYVAVTLLVSNTFLGPVLIPSGSMEPTLLVGDYLLVNRVSYALHAPFVRNGEVLRWGAPARGDIVIFNAPAQVAEGEELYIKRTVALAGDVVEVKADRLTVNGKPVQYEGLGPDTLRETLDGSVHTIKVGKSKLADFGPFQVPAEHIFVMGDHRNDSLDSRAWGALPLERVRGRAVARVWSFNKQSEGLGWLR